MITINIDERTPVGFLRHTAEYLLKLADCEIQYAPVESNAAQEMASDVKEIDESIKCKKEENQLEFDARGLPWDPRIHARTKSRDANNCWKNQRGINPRIVQQIEEELIDIRNLRNLPNTVELPEAPIVYIAPIAPLPSVPPPPKPISYIELMTIINHAVKEQKFTKEEVVKTCTTLGCPSLVLLAAKEYTHLIPQIHKVLFGAEG